MLSLLAGLSIRPNQSEFTSPAATATQPAELLPEAQSLEASLLSGNGPAKQDFSQAFASALSDLVSANESTAAQTVQLVTPAPAPTPTAAVAVPPGISDLLAAVRNAAPTMFAPASPGMPVHAHEVTILAAPVPRKPDTAPQQSKDVTPADVPPTSSIVIPVQTPAPVSIPAPAELPSDSQQQTMAISTTIPIPDNPQPQTSVTSTPLTPPPTAPPPTPASVPDSLSFAMVLHPKLPVQTPVAPNAPVAVTKPVHPTSGVEQIKTTSNSSEKIPAIEAAPESVVTPQKSDQSSVVQAKPVDNSPAQQQPATQTTAPQPTPIKASAPQPNVAVDRERPQPSQSASQTATPPPALEASKPTIVTPTAAPLAPASQPKISEAARPVPVAAHDASAPAPAAKEVTVRLQSESGESISVRLVDQGSHVQVAVRSSDPATATLIRQDLSSLTSNLDRAGWKPEVLTATQTLTNSTHQASQGSRNENQNSQGQGALDWSEQNSSRKKNTTADLWDEILTRQGT